MIASTSPPRRCSLVPLVGACSRCSPDSAFPPCAARGYAGEVFTYGLAGASDRAVDGPFALLGLGGYLALIRFLYGWGSIWRNQKRGLGIVEADADTKAKSARTAMLASRVNLLLSLPMLTSMAMYQTLFG